MNMVLHDNADAELWKDNTLANPWWKNKDGSLKQYDFAVANPPFSYKSWSSGITPSKDVFNRFELGIPPLKNGDYAFLLHIVKSLKSSGKAAVILPHGVLFRGNVEAEIRRNLITRGYIKGIIGLPANLFYGTGIPACIIVIDMERAGGRSGIFMIDAGKGFMKDGNKNRLRSRDIHKIVDVFTNEFNLPRFSRMVPFSEIEANDYNLNIPRYIDSGAEEDLHDLAAHLNGGIPTCDIDGLENFWQVFPGLRAELFAPVREGYVRVRVQADEIKPVILRHPEYLTFARHSLDLYREWEDAHINRLMGLQAGVEPGPLIFELSEGLLARYERAELIDKYDIYQHLMDYWAEVMQDDVYLISQDGWQGGNKPRRIMEKKGKKSKETPDFVIDKLKFKADLIPPALLTARYFAKEQEGIDSLQSEKDALSQKAEAFIEEHSGEGGLLEEAGNEKNNITKGSLKTRISLIRGDAGAADELKALKKCLDLLDKEADAEKAVKTAQKELDRKVFDKYPTLSVEEIKALVVRDKWLTVLGAEVEGEIERITRMLTERVKLLHERYALPLPELADNVTELTGKVEGHLKKMGLTW
jgi:type I restriction enzyme M protein